MVICGSSPAKNVIRFTSLVAEGAADGDSKRTNKSLKAHMPLYYKRVLIYSFSDVGGTTWTAAYLPPHS